MAIDLGTLSDKISALRNYTAKDSISPETLGELLQQIADILATAGDEISLENLSKWQTTLAGSIALCSLTQGKADANKVLFNYDSVNLKNGATANTKNQTIIAPATESQAGFMTALHAQHLAAVYSSVNDTILPTLGDIQDTISDIQTDIKKFGNSSNSSSSSSNSNSSTIVSSSSTHSYQIRCEVYDGRLYLYGSEDLRKYKLYVFRYTKTHNHSINLHKTYKVRKGWHHFGGPDVAQWDDDGEVLFSSADNSEKHLEGLDEFDGDPLNLITINEEKDTVSWGKGKIDLRDNYNKYRLVKLRFALAFGENYNNCNEPLPMSYIKTNFAEFIVSFNPSDEGWKWIFSK